MTRSVTQFSTAHGARRYNVLALALVLCVWMVAAAMHLHLKDQDGGSADSAHCAFCFALSTSAAPASEFQVPAIIAAPAIAVPSDDKTVAVQPAPSSYLSRGPPSA